jgi:hypothetical protein
MFTDEPDELLLLYRRAVTAAFIVAMPMSGCEMLKE